MSLPIKLPAPVVELGLSLLLATIALIRLKCVNSDSDA